MATYRLPPDPELAAALARKVPVPDRLHAFLSGRGYVVGAGGAQAYPDGSITIDVDRDPSADAAAWDPTVPAPVETEDRDRQRQIRAALTQLDSDAALLLGTGNVTAATQRQILGRLCRIVAGLIRILIRRALIERDDG